MKDLAPLDGLLGLSDATLTELRTGFAASGFSLALLEQTEAFVPGVLREPRLPLLRWWLARRPEPGAVLARLFVYEDTLNLDELRSVLGATLVDALVAAGVLVTMPGDRIVARFSFTPTGGGLWILSDSHVSGRDAVMGPGGGTEMLGRLVPRPFQGAVLDVGCGAGSLALTAARAGATRAVGIDVNPRAVEIARFNARLNRVAAEFLVGDVVGPVAAEQFDLVLAQPPFVVRPPDQPEVTYLYGGPTGDELPMRFLADIPGVLAPGGRAILLMQTAERDHDPLATRLRRALPADPAVDLLVLGLPAPPPAAQATVFASYADSGLGDIYAETARRFLDHFEQQGMHTFVVATVVLGRPRAETPERASYTLGLMLGHGHYDAVSLDRFLDGLELIEQPAAILELERLRMSPLVQLIPDPAGPDESGLPRAIVHVDPPGIGYDFGTGPGEIQILATLQSSDTVGAALEASAAARKIPADAFRQEFLDFVRGALMRGALVRQSRIVT